MTDNLAKRDQPDRSKINMNEVRYWTKHRTSRKKNFRRRSKRSGTQPPLSARNWRCD